MLQAIITANFILYDHGNQFLLIFGIFNTLLLLPLEEYAMAEESAPIEEEPPPANDDEKKPLMHSQPIGSIPLTPGDLQGRKGKTNSNIV